MPRWRFATDQILQHFREAELLLSPGKTVAEEYKKIRGTDQTYYRSGKEYGSLKINQAKRHRKLEKENTRLKRLLADAELDKVIQKEAASANF